MAWSEAARQASIEARRANAAAKARQNNTKNRVAQMQQSDMAKKYPNGVGKPGPQTDKHPNPGNRVAFATRNRMIHDAGAAGRIAAHNRQVMLAAGGHFTRAAGAGLLGVLMSVGGALGKLAMENTKVGGRR